MKKLAALLTLIIWSISTAASASVGLSVLCVEKSGAATIEYSLGSRCADQEQAKLATSKQQTTVSSAHCPSCTDTSLNTSVANSVPRIAAKVLAAEPAVATLAVISSPVFTHINGVRAPPKIETPPVRSAYLVQRPTIVILQ